MPIFFTKKYCNRGLEPPPQMPLTVNRLIICIATASILVRLSLSLFYAGTYYRNAYEMHRILVSDGAMTAKLK